MRRSEYESHMTHRTDPLETRFMKETSRLDALLADLRVKVNLYQEGSIFMYRLLDQNENEIIEGLNPAYANAGDYRRIVLALTDRPGL